MKVPKLSDASLNGLRSFDQLSLVNAIDSLRSSGIDHYVSLPQIIVCGDQSSGKSSVLEAISGVPFPIKSTICTRFPIELVLRNAPVEALEVRIVPHQSRSESDQQSLLSFNKTLESISDIPELINSAKSAMTVLTPGMSFSRDILRIEIHGPEGPHLTIVDLPGLIHSETKDQSVDDVTLIQEVVQVYMKQERTIILAVVSAKNDHANQMVLRLCRTIDPRGRRTLGIVTKPDTLLQGSPTEQKFISLVKNDDIKFSLGWHVLRNLDSEEGSYSLEHRNTREEYFFSRGNWAGIPASSLGIKNLKSRLSKLLVQQIAIELPALIIEIETKSSWCISQLNQMGKPRESMEEKRGYLVQLSQSFQRLVTAATEGTYNDRFFADATTGFDKRLRAVIQKLSIAFSAEMRKNGREYVLSSQAGCKSRVVTHEQLCGEVMDLVEKTRGRELPGLLNPMIISDLFRKLSSPWEDIASSYVEKVWKATQTFLNHALKAVTDNGTAEAIMNIALRPKLARIRENLHTKLDELLQPHREGHPITYRDNFEQGLHKDCFTEEAIRSTIDGILRQYLNAEPSSQTAYISGSIDLQGLRSELLELHRPYFENARYNAKCAISYVDKYYEV
jgi:GTP-binding protein EngB required for normal cell division